MSLSGENFFLVHRPITEAEATCRSIFLDFDRVRRVVNYYGENSRYSEARLNQESIDRILATLNDMYVDADIEFTTEPPPNMNYNTICVERAKCEPSPGKGEAIDVAATDVVSDSERKLIEAISKQAEKILNKRRGSSGR